MPSRRTNLRTCLPHSWLHKYTMKSQIIIIQLFTVLAIILLIQIVYLINGLISQAIIFQASQQLLLNETSKNQIILARNLQRQVNQHFENRFNILDNINNLYELANRVELETENTSPCNFTEKDSNSLVFKLDMFCFFYSNNTINPFTITNNKIDNKLQNVASILDQHMLIFEKQFTREMIYMTTVTDDAIVVVNPRLYYFPQYRAHLRPWYTEHMRYIQQNPQETEYISSIYSHYIYKNFEVSQSRSLKLGDELHGLIVYNNDFKGIQFNNPQLSIMLLNSTGRILSSNFHFDQPIDFTNTTANIFDQSLTGFNNEDWEQMKIVSSNGTGISNCEIQTQSLCRYNRLFKGSVIINTFDYMDAFYLVVFSNLTITKEHQNYSESLYLDFIDQYNNLFYGYILVSVCLILFSFLCLGRIFKPLELVQYCVQLYVSQKFTFQLRLIQPKQGSNNVLDIITNSVLLFWTKLQKGSRKSAECLLFEQFQYPNKQEVKLPCAQNLQQIESLQETYNEQQLERIQSKIVQSLRITQEEQLDRHLSN